MGKPVANQQPTPSQVSGRLATLHRVLAEAGLPYEALQMPIDDPGMRKRLVRFWISGGYEAITSQKRAREIMGNNFFGVEEAIRHFGVNPSRQQSAVLAEIPFTEEVLQAVKDTHVLVAVFPLSILNIRDKVEHQLFCSHNDAWYNEQAFAKDRGEVRWQLVRKTPVENSTGKTWQEQQALLSDLLSDKEETPTAQVMVYAIIGYFLATGERLLEKIYVRCSDLTSGGTRVCVGDFATDGLPVYSFWGGSRLGSIGLASARKF